MLFPSGQGRRRKQSTYDLTQHAIASHSKAHRNFSSFLLYFLSLFLLCSFSSQFSVTFSIFTCNRRWLCNKLTHCNKREHYSLSVWTWVVFRISIFQLMPFFLVWSTIDIEVTCHQTHFTMLEREREREKETGKSCYCQLKTVSAFFSPLS